MDETGRFIVLKKLKYGEADLIIQTLSRDGARMDFLAKSALKSKKRFGGGVLEPTLYIEALYRRRGDDDGALHLIKDAKVVDDFRDLRSDIDRLDTALYFVRLMSKVSYVGDVENSGNFNLLGNALKLAESTENLEALKTQFEIKFLHYQGILAPDRDLNFFLEHPLNEHDQLKRKLTQDVLRKVSFELSQFMGG